MSTAKVNLGRRNFPRRRFQRKLGILVDGTYSIGMGVEIGEGGLSFAIGEKIAKGRHLVVSFQVPQGNFVSILAEVKSQYVDKSTGLQIHGVAYRALPFEAKREVRTYVSSRTEIEGNQGN